ncbi:MAG: hypothetical protein IKZ47_03350 [Clostridia bacterium]|nr:hypothetical protein [Clostridia bacterium]
MRSVLRKLLATVICLLLLFGMLPVSAETEETATGIKSYTLHSYASPAGGAVTAGDVNGDGKVNNKDLTRLFQYLSDWEVDVNADLLDINGDSKVNNKDLTRLFQFLSDWEVEIFPQVVCDHDGDTEIRGALEPTCDSDGYTGDTYCLLCNMKIASGEIIPATGRHVGGVANCHSGAICEVCGSEYGDKDPSNHDGGTFFANGYPAGCDTVGYTGDIFCAGCGGYISRGEETSPTGHTGGTATCHTLATCTVCGKQYGDFNYNNHDGGTELRYAYPAGCTTPGYTGDTFCLGCNTIIQTGTFTEPTGHTLGEWLRDESEHWRNCSGCAVQFDRAAHTFVDEITPPNCQQYGYTTHTCTVCGYFYIDSFVQSSDHVGGVATCHSKPICSVCGAEYGDYDPDNHDGGVNVYLAYPATCDEPGNTGYTYCRGCGALLQGGEQIPATGHNFGAVTYPVTCTEVGYTEYTCLTCGKSYTADYVYPTGHTGGTATCHSGAICEVCGAEYGDYDYNNHDGGTAIEDATDPTDTELGYSGNEICLGCHQVISYGNYYDKSHVHMGDPDATYYRPGICWLCRKEYYAQMSAYDCLNENQQGFYRRLQNMVYFLEMSKVDVTEYCGDFSTYEDDINIAFKALSYDRPDMFWMPRQISIPYTYNQRTGKIISVYLTFNPEGYYNTPENQREVYGLDEAMRDAMLEQMDAKVDEIVALTANLDTDFEKEILIHDYICDNVVYDFDTAFGTDYDEDDPTGVNPAAGGGYNRLSFTAYGALVNGLAVCEGYSRAMQIVCQKIGIPCGLVTGYVNGGGHMWNIINPGDGCYYLDVTFDDVDGYSVPAIHTYFNQTREVMETDHTFDDLYEEGAPLKYYDYDDECWYVIDYNFLYTHGDFTALEYYTATGAYITGNNAESAANYTVYKFNNGYTSVAIKYGPDLGYEGAYRALEVALKKHGLKLLGSYSIISNDIIIVSVSQ